MLVNYTKVKNIFHIAFAQKNLLRVMRDIIIWFHSLTFLSFFQEEEINHNLRYCFLYLIQVFFGVSEYAGSLLSIRLKELDFCKFLTINYTGMKWLLELIMAKLEEKYVKMIRYHYNSILMLLLDDVETDIFKKNWSMKRIGIISVDDLIVRILRL